MRMQILQIFNRKIHPENSTSCHQSHKPTKNEIKHSNSHLLASESGGLRPSAEDIIIYPHQPISKDSTWSCKSHSHLPQITKSTGDSTGSEFWVKTDSDCKYLMHQLYAMTLQKILWELIWKLVDYLHKIFQNI